MVCYNYSFYWENRFFRFNMSKTSSGIDLGYKLCPFSATASVTGVLLLSGVIV